ncbi:MAG: hypothetical protein HY904_20495 [Deltaproteobacteria bacterium]|nr:hypothetical protein [Deltaproteobacteria bacterium]
MSAARIHLAALACGTLLLACPRPAPTVTADDPAPRLEGLGDGALLSQGAHDVMLVVHHALDYDATEVERQVQLGLALVDAAKAQHEAGRATVKLGVVAVGRQAQVVLPLTDDVAQWRGALVNGASFEIEGAAAVAAGVEAALSELVGARSRGAALPVIFHAATRGEAVTPMLAEQLAAAGVVLVGVGAEASGVQPEEGAHVASLVVPADGDAVARLGGLLAWGGAPLRLGGRVGSGWGVRLAVLDAAGEVVLRGASEGTEVNADLDWRPADQGRRFNIRITATHPDRPDRERIYAVRALPQDRQPVVLDVSPAVAAPGQSVTVTGRFFDVSTGGAVLDVGTETTPTAVTKVSLQFVVPVGAVDGALVVRSGGVASVPALFRVDTDGDTLADGDELARGTDPARRDTDGDGLDDGADDCPAEASGVRHVDARGCTLCTDGQMNGPETDVDCGGPCAPCAGGGACAVAADCAGGACLGGRCLPDHCQSGTEDGDEVATDCGGSCGPCADGVRCVLGLDCDSHTCLAHVCRAASCANGVKDGTESATDCGGACTPCAEAAACVVASDCASARCVDGLCAPSLCDDAVLNGSESDVDCGGLCTGCETALHCHAHADCASGVCTEGACAASTCNDSVRNGDETGRDCGGGRCLACGQGDFCAAATDCVTGVCEAGVCAPPRCGDGVRNAEETDVDCGGGCDRCALGRACLADTDCASAACQDATLCVLPSCVNAALDGEETDVDCGGGCIPCHAGRACLLAGDCASQRCGPDSVCLPPACDDQLRNGTETDVDCGSTCPERCAQDRRCTLDNDCVTGVCVAGSCAAPSCTDGVQNGLERGVDCAGGTCGRCTEGSSCLEDVDCASDHCISGRCLSPTCADGQLNGSETSLDCGGACPGCLEGERCNVDADCAERVCVDAADAGSAAGRACAAPTCLDGVRNGGEGDVDCGGECDPCAVGRTCNTGAQCASQVCTPDGSGTHCAEPSCTDGQMNGAEVGQDCGGGCPGCADGEACAVDGDCTSGVCSAEGGAPRCAAATCADQVRNGSEGDVDCGAACPERCATGLTCNDATDCNDGRCDNGVCPPAACDDGVHNGAETGVDCGGGCPGCADGTACAAATDCASKVCSGATSTCAVPSCDDGQLNGTETALDCGGGCTGCPLWSPCKVTSDCGPDLACQMAGDDANTMALACVDARSCFDGVKNLDEADVDCGPFAPCPLCGVGSTCRSVHDCSTSLCVEGRCRADSAFDKTMNGGETDVDCGGDALPCQVGQHCAVSTDCRSGWCHAAVCDYAPSCATLLRSNAAAPSGSYLLLPPGERTAVPVQCDMTTERGGWTLVGHATGVPIKDVGSEYYADLGRTQPTAPAQGVWRGLRGLSVDNVDMRFACSPTAGAPLAVDLSFFSVDWYAHLTAGTDADSCFGVPGSISLAPARRNNLDGTALGAGTPWERGALVGESFCGDADDFTVDFSESGLDGNELDGTDWGEDDGQPKCGSGYAPAGAWELWVREAVDACANNVRDDGEDGVDCGGSCGACPAPCTTNAECPSNICLHGGCEPARCVDRLRNGDESDVDCGGSCAPCEPRKACRSAADCAEGQCAEGVCRPAACYDGQISTYRFVYDCIGDILCRLDEFTEPEIDCGGPCSPCQRGHACYRPEDCTTGYCPTNPAVQDDGGVLYVGVCTDDPCHDGALTVTQLETDVDCGGPACGKCAGGKSCMQGSDCFSGDCVNGTCRGLASCLDVQGLPGTHPSGLYDLTTPDGTHAVYCDMDTDQGGWTLVGASAGTPPSDEAGAFHADLQTLVPAAAHPGIWNGPRTQMGARQDVRFACGRLGSTTGMVVDLTFYGVDWYTVMTTGTEAESCLNQGDGAGFSRPEPARRNNVTGVDVAAGTAWAAGFLETEDSCASPDDFTVDLADRGLDSNEADGTDWGLDDGLAKCGSQVGDGWAWFVFVREGSACRDGVRGPGEDWIDCGGPCRACPVVPACVPGEANLDGSNFTPCTACAQGEYCAGANAPPVPCVAGEVDDDNSPTTPCLACEAGQYCPGGANDASACPPGTSDADLSSATPCGACAAGQFCAGGAAPAADCAPGQADDDRDPATPCRPCVAGEFCGGGAQAPVTCAAGTADADGDPSTACVACSAGTYCAGGPAAVVTCAPAGVDHDSDPATPCVFNATHVIGGRVVGDPLATPLVLQNNLTDDTQVAAVPVFTFAQALPEGAPYSVTVLQPPQGMACAVSNGTGTVGATDVTDVVVRCYLRVSPPDFAWFDATDTATLTKDASGNVTQWRDKSGQGRHASVAGAAPVWRAAVSPAGGAAVEFNGSTVALQTASVPTSALMTIFVVYQMNTPQAWGALLNQDHDTYFSIRKAEVGMAAGGLNFHIRNNNDEPALAIQTGAWQVLTVVQDLDVTFMSHAGGEATLAFQLPIDAGSAPITLGNSFISGQSMGGHIAEIRAYSWPLSPPERTAVEAELAAKHTLQPPVGFGLRAAYNARATATLTRDGADRVSAWADSAGISAALGPYGTAPRYVTGLFGDRPGVDFTGRAGLSAANIPLGLDATVFAVFRQGNPERWGAIAHHGSRDMDWSLEQSGSQVAGAIHFQSNNDNAGAELVCRAGPTYILAGRTMGGLRELTATSTDEGTVFAASQGVSITPGNKTLYVGRSDADEASNAYLGELLYFDRPLEDPERDAVITYLQHAWRVGPGSL